MATTGVFNVAIILDALKKSISLDNADILHCAWKEDIYMQGSLGKLIIHDRHGLKEYGPLTGDEKVLLSYGNTALISREFSLIKINKISSVTSFKQAHESVLELCFTETYHRNLTMKKFSKAWVKKKASDIVKDIIENMLEVKSQDLNLETSDREIDHFYMPWWTPADALRHLTARAKGTRGRCNYGYLFFSNSNAYINFVTLDTLLNNAQTDPDVYILETSDMNYVNKVLSWETAGVDHSGMREFGGGQLLGFNPETKEFLGLDPDPDFVYSKAVANISTLGRSSLFDGAYVDNDSTKFNYTYSLEGETDKEILKNIFYNNFIRRYSLQNMSKLVLTGHNKRYAGMKINVQWPSMSTNDLFSSMDSGEYLIKAIVHNMTPMYTPYYTQTLHVMKNAYSSNKFNTTTSVSGTLNKLVSSVMKLGKL